PRTPARTSDHRSGQKPGNRPEQHRKQHRRRDRQHRAYAALKYPSKEAWNNALFGRKNKDLLAVVTADGTALAVTVGLRRQDRDVDRQNAGGQGGLALLDRGGRGLLLERLVAGVSRCSHEERTHGGTSDQASSGHLLDHASPEKQLRGIDRKDAGTSCACVAVDGGNLILPQEFCQRRNSRGDLSILSRAFF